MKNAQKQASTRALVTLSVAFTGLLLPVTGIANHIYGFSPMSVARHAWMTAHNLLGLLFVVFSIWHALLNRRALWSHVKNAARRAKSASIRDKVTAGIVAAVFMLVFVAHAFHPGG